MEDIESLLKERGEIFRRAKIRVGKIDFFVCVIIFLCFFFAIRVFIVYSSSRIFYFKVMVCGVGLFY